MDVKSLYTSIPHTGGLAALKHYLDLRQTQVPPTSTLLRLAELVLTLNNFAFNGEHYIQTSGVAMGTRMGPSYACLFVGHIEEQMLTQYQGVRPLMYRRYIDDIFGAFTGTCDDVAKFTEFADAFHPALRFTSNVSQHSVTFLDVRVQICARKLDTTVHYKPTDSHSYLQYQSSHPHKCKNSIPYSQFLRLRRICSSDAEFSERGKEMLGFFHQRGYPSAVTDAAFNAVSSIPRETALEPSKAKKHDRIPLVLTYHPRNIPIRNVILKHFRTLGNDAATASIFNEPPICAFRRDRSVGDMVVRSRLDSVSPSQVGNNAPCQRARCNTCPYIVNSPSVVGPRGTYRVRGNHTCVTSNVVYCITCRRCGKLYIGETKRRLGDRFAEHLRSVRQQTPGLTVAQHFGAPPHTLSDVSVCVLRRASSDVQRKELEQRVIFELGTLHPGGMNVDFSAFIQN